MAYQTDPAHAKTFTVSAGYKYTYLAIKTTAHRPTFLFFHGFPSTSFDWRRQVEGLSAQGYGIIAPDLLGFGGSDKPLDIDEYRQRKIAQHVKDILDHEAISKVIVVGHDWGVSPLTWFVQDNSDRCFGIVTISVTYREPGCFTNIDERISASEAHLGYSALGYWKFFIAPEAGNIFDKNPRSVFSLLYPEDPSLWTTDFCPVGAAQKWIESGQELPPPAFCPRKEMDIWLSIWSQHGGFQQALNWYRAGVFGNNDKDEISVAEDAKTTDLPTLFIASAHDAVLPPTVVTGRARASCTNLQVEVLDTGHWTQLEKPHEVNKLLVDFSAVVAPH